MKIIIIEMFLPSGNNPDDIIHYTPDSLAPQATTQATTQVTTQAAQPVVTAQAAQPFVTTQAAQPRQQHKHLHNPYGLYICPGSYITVPVTDIWMCDPPPIIPESNPTQATTQSNEDLIFPYFYNWIYL